MDNTNPTITRRKNVGRMERWLSGAAGLFFLFKGLRQRKNLSGLALGGLGAALLSRASTGHCEGYRILGIDRTESQSARKVIRRKLVVTNTPSEVYAFWRNPQNLAQLSRAIQSVIVTDLQHSQWKVTTPIGLPLEWEAEIIEDRSGEIIAWQSQPGTRFENAGSVRFETPSGGWGTTVHLQFAYQLTIPALQTITASVSEKLIGRQVDDALARLQEILNTRDKE